ncbi:MAG: hypothetical protein COB02_18160 [Candidatus Cloacimonadota bacterium]|nr:MAG: hypothetical protein COB02_18160 [Candidatus Cloacimonadota bacterium]
MANLKECSKHASYTGDRCPLCLEERSNKGANGVRQEWQADADILAQKITYQDKIDLSGGFTVAPGVNLAVLDGNEVEYFKGLATYTPHSVTHTSKKSFLDGMLGRDAKTSISIESGSVSLYLAKTNDISSEFKVKQVSLKDGVILQELVINIRFNIKDPILFLDKLFSAQSNVRLFALEDAIKSFVEKQVKVVFQGIDLRDYLDNGSAFQLSYDTLKQYLLRDFQARGLDLSVIESIEDRDPATNKILSKKSQNIVSSAMKAQEYKARENTLKEGYTEVSFTKDENDLINVQDNEETRAKGLKNKVKLTNQGQVNDCEQASQAQQDDHDRVMQDQSDRTNLYKQSQKHQFDETTQSKNIDHGLRTAKENVRYETSAAETAYVKKADLEAMQSADKRRGARLKDSEETELGTLNKQATLRKHDGDNFNQSLRDENEDRDYDRNYSNRKKVLNDEGDMTRATIDQASRTEQARIHAEGSNAYLDQDTIAKSREQKDRHGFESTQRSMNSQQKIKDFENKMDEVSVLHDQNLKSLKSNFSRNEETLVGSHSRNESSLSGSHLRKESLLDTENDLSIRGQKERYELNSRRLQSDLKSALDSNEFDQKQKQKMQSLSDELKHKIDSFEYEKQQYSLSQTKDSFNANQSQQKDSFQQDLQDRSSDRVEKSKDNDLSRKLAEKAASYDFEMKKIDQDFKVLQENLSYKLQEKNLSNRLEEKDLDYSLDVKKLDNDLANNQAKWEALSKIQQQEINATQKQEFRELEFTIKDLQRDYGRLQQELDKQNLKSELQQNYSQSLSQMKQEQLAEKENQFNENLKNAREHLESYKNDAKSVLDKYFDSSDETRRDFKDLAYSSNGNRTNQNQSQTPTNVHVHYDKNSGSNNQGQQAPKASNKSFCANCGTKRNQGVNFCDNCGSRHA